MRNKPVRLEDILIKKNKIPKTGTFHSLIKNKEISSKEQMCNMYYLFPYTLYKYYKEYPLYIEMFEEIKQSNLNELKK